MSLDGYAGSKSFRLESPGWQNATLAAAKEYLAKLESDPSADELAIVAARHEVLLRKRALEEEIPTES